MIFHVASGCATPKEKAAAEIYPVEFCEPLHERRFPGPRTAANPEHSGGWSGFFDPAYDVLGSILACARMTSRRWITLRGIVHGSMRNCLAQNLNTHSIMACEFQDSERNQIPNSPF